VSDGCRIPTRHGDVPPVNLAAPLERDDHREQRCSQRNEQDETDEDGAAASPLVDRRDALGRARHRRLPMRGGAPWSLGGFEVSLIERQGRIGGLLEGGAERPDEAACEDRRWKLRESIRF
jgi:hypothetical protein